MRIGIDQSPYAGWSPALDDDFRLIICRLKVVPSLIAFGQFFAH
jgi:hypothetical protein